MSEALVSRVLQPLFKLCFDDEKLWAANVLDSTLATAFPQAKDQHAFPDVLN